MLLSSSSSLSLSSLSSRALLPAVLGSLLKGFSFLTLDEDDIIGGKVLLDIFIRRR